MNQPFSEAKQNLLIGVMRSASEAAMRKTWYRISIFEYRRLQAAAKAGSISIIDGVEAHE
jgi:hypothetical protein